MSIRPVIFILLLCSSLFSQTKDTTQFIPGKGPAADSLSSLGADTTRRSTSDINAVIYSSGSDSLIFRVDKKKLEIYGNGQLKYKTTELKSANIDVNFNTNQIHATGVADTSDTAKTKIKGTPVMSEAGEVYEGENLTYDFRTQRGLISAAKTKAEGSLYGGSKVKKISQEAYFIKDGTYTTCTADTSHYFFYAKEMKVVLKEQIVAKWIWLYIGGVPLPVPLPFGVFPNETGRRSGLIAPAYGQSADWGQYFSHLGYFWAINDYMDINLLSDIYFRGGYNLNSTFRYSKRYSMTGSIQAGYSNLHTGYQSDYNYSQNAQWQLSLYHNQQIDPSTRLDANLRFISSQAYLKNTSFSRNDALTQQITSNATLYKNWEESGNSISLGYQRTQILNSADSTQIGNITEVLPTVSFSKSQAYPFRAKKGYDPTHPKWYEMIGYTYSGLLQNNRNMVNGESNSRAGIQHSISSSASPKIGYFNVSPFISYTERWYDKQVELVRAVSPSSLSEKQRWIYQDVNKISSVRTFSFGVGANTKLYGILQPRALGVEAVRHIVSPSISYSYTPDFSKPQWGYYAQTDTGGVTVRYDKYQRELWGSGASIGEQQRINVRIDNNIELKTTKDPSDTTSESKKIQLLNFSASTSYNFAAGAINRLSDLALDYWTRVADFIDLRGSSTYSFYDYDYTGNGSVSQRYLTSRPGGGLLRLTNFNFSAGIALSAERFKGSTEKTPAQSDVTPGISNNQVRSEYTGLYNDQPPDYSIPWDMSLNLVYNLSKLNPANPTKTANVSGNLNFNLTPSLKISMTSNYDLNTKQFLYPEIRVYKDLHCWEMNFTWNPIGSWAGYRFEIRIKASQLRDIKVERSRGQYSGR